MSITNNLNNKWVNELNRHLSNEEIKMANEYMKDFQYP
jgi:hypothetical protein